MRKFLLLVCGLLIFSLMGCTVQAPVSQSVVTSEVMSSQQWTYTQAVYEITFSAQLLYNNSVGNEWSFQYACEGERISSGKQWTVALDCVQNITVDVAVIEKEKVPDEGYGSLEVVLQDGFETSTTVTIAENAGRYKDNTAQFSILCKVALIGYQ